jgi:Zn-dependent protease with chaperone function
MLYTRALEYGDHPDFYFGRAETYHFSLDDPDTEGCWSNYLSTHPDTEERLRRFEEAK